MKVARFLTLIAALAAPLAFAARADAVIVERVVAIVGERPILLSELRHRARPNRIRILGSVRDANMQAAAETEMYKELLQRLIDERLEEQAADKARLSVTSEEIDRGIQNVAANAKVSPEDLLVEVQRQGLTEQDLRDEVRRQILEGKLIELRVRPRVRVTEQDARAAYQHWRQEVSEQRPVELRAIALRVNGPADDRARMELAEEIVTRARSGEDFCGLVSKYSDDTETKATCGSRGAQPMQALVPAVQEVVRNMKPGEISDPIRIRMGSDAIIIVELLTESKVPPYEEVKGEMGQRALLEGIDRQRKLWLQELRRGVYIDSRL
jgi:peptidyl-prolyl cis-trans isomerase SurA